MNITSGVVSFESGGILRTVYSGHAQIGNIIPNAAQIIFSESLVEAVGVAAGSQNVDTHIDYIAALMFMADPTLDLVSSPTGIHPLDLSAINCNMDSFVHSAAKAFADGYFPVDTYGPDAIVNFTTMPVNVL
jgi:hypothetical protein